VEEAVRQDVSNLIAKFESDGSCDLVRDFAEEIPLLALCHIIGFDEDKRSEVRRLTLQTLTDFEEPEKAAAAFMEFSRFGVEAVMQRREDPRDDFLTELSIAEIDGRRLTEIEIGQLMNSFLVAGHGTTVAALSSLLYEVLLRKPVRQQLIENPELVPAAVEETLRLHTPFFGLYRRATRPTEVAGVKIPEDGYLLACWAAANRDPAVYDDPKSFKLDRKFTRRNRHLTFGFGLHTCPGAPVARMEMRVAAEELLRRLPDIELTDPDSIKFEFGGTETAAIPALLARFDPRK
jgi:cytochrome P450